MCAGSVFSLVIITLATRSIQALLRQPMHPPPVAFVSSDPAVPAAARLLAKCKNVLTSVNNTMSCVYVNRIHLHVAINENGAFTEDWKLTQVSYRFNT